MAQLFTILEQIFKTFTAEAQRKATQRKTGFLCVTSAPLRLCGKALCFSGSSGLG
jgi:hypothetical protein